MLGQAYALLAPYSWPEPFGLALIEALACGTPVIGTWCGAKVPVTSSDLASGLTPSSQG